MKTLIAARSRWMLGLAIAGFGTAAPLSVQADDDYHHHETAHLGVCLEQVSKIKHTDDFVKVEYLTVTHEGDPSFEIEVRDSKGTEWEFMCEVNDGSIYEVEQEADSANDPRFEKEAEINEQQAREQVTALYPGRVKEIEYEIESSGEATYEIDVVDDHSTEFKAEVDAASGKIIELHVEAWEIGIEPKEIVED